MITINRERISREEFEERLQSIRERGIAHGLHGRSAALCLQEPLDTVLTVLALRSLEASVLLIHSATPEDTARGMAEAAGCDVLLFGAPEHIRRIQPEVSSIMHLPDASEIEAGSSTETSLMQYSSGTTGAPKLIRRSWQEIDREVAAYNEALGEAAGCTPVVLVPVSHSYGLICGVLAALARGIAPTVITHSNPKMSLAIIRETPRHLVYGVPLLFHVMSSLTPSDFRFGRIMSSGAPLPAALFAKLARMTDHVMQQYGCTEAGCIAIASDMAAANELGSPLATWRLDAAGSGTAEQPAEITIYDQEDGRMIATGDLGFADASGCMYYLSRIDDVINIGGLKVYPLEVEERLAAFEAAKEAVVYRGVHPVMGEAVHAQVVLREEASGAQSESKAETEERLRSWCSEALPPYKVPSMIRIVTELPRTATGKISRKLIALKGGE